MVTYTILRAHVKATAWPRNCRVCFNISPCHLYATVSRCLISIVMTKCCLFSSYRKVSRQLRMREAAGDPISLLQDVPSVFPAQQFQQQRVVTANPVCTSSSYSRVNQLQQGSNLPMSPYSTAQVKLPPLPLRNSSKLQDSGP